MRGQGLNDADLQIFNDLETLYKYGDQWSILTMKHRKRPLDLGDNQSASSHSGTNSKQPSNTKRKQVETSNASMRHSEEKAHSQQSTTNKHNE